MTPRPEQIGFLQHLANKHGDFRVCTRDGESCTKWVSVQYCTENPKELWRLATANQREIFHSEIILDLDPAKDETSIPDWKIKNIISQLKYYDLTPFKIYHSGSKGVHIHIFEADLVLFDKYSRQKIRKYLISKLSADLMLASENHMITIENSPNAKTGQLKTLIFQYGNTKNN